MGWNEAQYILDDKYTGTCGAITFDVVCVWFTSHSNYFQKKLANKCT